MTRRGLALAAGLIGACAATTLASAAPASTRSPADAQRAFFAANEAYRQGRFNEAADSYQSLLAEAYRNAALCFNAGNAWLKRGEPGEALWAYLQAAKLAPRDPDIRANLEFVRSMAEGSGASVALPRPWGWAFFGGRWSARELAWAWVCGLWLMLGAWAAHRWGVARWAGWRAACWVATAITGVLGITLLVQAWSIEGSRHGVVITRNEPVRFAPQPSGTTHYELPEGSIVRILDHQGGWAQVRRPDGRTGWIRAEAVKEL